MDYKVFFSEMYGDWRGPIQPTICLPLSCAYLLLSPIGVGTHLMLIIHWCVLWIGPGLLIWLQLGLWLYAHWAEVAQQWVPLLVQQEAPACSTQGFSFPCCAAGMNSALSTGSVSKPQVLLLFFPCALQPCSEEAEQTLANRERDRPYCCKSRRPKGETSAPWSTNRLRAECDSGNLTADLAESKPLISWKQY